MKVTVHGCRRGATMVEFALVAPIFFAMVIGLISAVTYVFEVQVANDSAQAAARWAVAAINFNAGAIPGPQCPSPTPPSGPSSTMMSVARQAAGPLASSLVYNVTLVNAAAPAESGVSGGSSGTLTGCEITVTVPFVSFGGYFGIGPRSITATAIDYVT